MNQLMNELMTEVFVEQPLASPGSAKKTRERWHRILRYGLKYSWRPCNTPRHRRGIFQGRQEYFQNSIRDISTAAKASGSEAEAAVEMLRMLFSQ